MKKRRRPKLEVSTAGVSAPKQETFNESHKQLRYSASSPGEYMTTGII